MMSRLMMQSSEVKEVLNRDNSLKIAILNALHKVIQLSPTHNQDSLLIFYP